MKKGKLYGVGVGAGDKEDLTLKALRVLKEADVIAVPKMKCGACTAYDIVKERIEGKEIILCEMPMNKDIKILSDNYAEIADIIEKRLLNGDNVAFITLGDPTVYSTYMQIDYIIKKRGYKTEIISGVTSFCAAAAKLGISLCERDEPLIVLPASYNDVQQWLQIKGNKVLMKAGSSILDIINILKEEYLLKNSQMVECCGMENEKIYTNLTDIKEKTSYFSIMIVKDDSDKQILQ